MKRLLIILFCLPLLFACQKEELFEEGQEIVLKFSVDVGNLQSATRAFDEDADRSSDLWLVLFDKSGYLVNQPIKATIVTPTGDETEFSVTLPATVEERIVHFLLNPPLNSGNKFELEYGHENNLIGGLIAGPNHDVYWQRVELLNILNENVLGTTPIPLVRNFAKITVTEEVNNFEIAEVYVLNKPNKGTVAPFLNGNFLDYLSYKDENTNKITYAKLNTAGYYGFMPREYDLINSSANGSNNNSVNDFFEAENNEDGSFYDYLYESTNSANNVSVLIKSTAASNNWYRVDLVKAGTGGVLEYYDVLRNFNYHINITGVDVGHSSVADAIQQPAGNNILNSVILSNLTSVTDDQTNATLEVSYTDTVLTKTGEVKVKYRFTVGSQNKNGNIAGKSDKDGWYYTWEGQEEGKPCPISEEISFGSSEDANGWREVTINVKECVGRNVELTFYAVEGDNNRVLSRTVTFYLLGEQKLKVECTPLVPLGVGQAVDVSLLIPTGLPETMFPLNFAIESQAKDNTSYLAQYLSPHEDEQVSVQTRGSIVTVGNLNGKKSFQYVVTLTYDEYDEYDEADEETVDGISMKRFTTKFITNTAQSASTVYAYNSYFNLGKDNFDNIDLRAVFTTDNTNYYGVDRTATLEIQSDKAGTYVLSSETFDLDNATRNVSDNFTLAANETKIIKLKTNSFANQGKVKLNCTINGVEFEKEIVASVRNKIVLGKVSFASGNGNNNPNDTKDVTIQYTKSNKTETVGSATASELKSGGVELEIDGITSLSESITLDFSYTTNGFGGGTYKSSKTATVQDFINGITLSKFNK